MKVRRHDNYNTRGERQRRCKTSKEGEQCTQGMKKRKKNKTNVKAIIMRKSMSQGRCDLGGGSD